MKSSAIRASDGFAYLLALMAAAILTGAVLILVDEAGIELAMAYHNHDALRAEWLARAASQHAIWRMRYDSNYRDQAENGLTATPVTDSLPTGHYAYSTQPASLTQWVIDGWGGDGSSGHESARRISDDRLAPYLMYYPDKDVMISEAKPDWNFGLYPLHVRAQSNHRCRVLVEFPVPFNPELVVENAILELWLEDSHGDEVLDLGVYRLKEDWEEGMGRGEPTFWGADWIRRTVWDEWSGPGAEGDYDENPVDVINLEPRSGVCRWDVTSVVDDWVKGNDDPNYGFMIRAVSETEFNPEMEERVFSSRVDPAHSPVLLVRYDRDSWREIVGLPP